MSPRFLLDLVRANKDATLIADVDGYIPLHLALIYRHSRRIVRAIFAANESAKHIENEVNAASLAVALGYDCNIIQCYKACMDCIKFELVGDKLVALAAYVDSDILADVIFHAITAGYKERTIAMLFEHDPACAHALMVLLIGNPAPEEHSQWHILHYILIWVKSEDGPVHFEFSDNFMLRVFDRHPFRKGCRG